MGHAPRPHLARHANALDDTRGCGARADRARCPDVVRAVAHRAAVESVSANRALEALALGAARDLHLLALLEGLDRDLIADIQRLVACGLVAELGERPQRARAGFLQVAELWLCEPLLRGFAPGQLDRSVAVTLGVSYSRDGTGPGLDQRDRNALTVLRKYLSHPELAPDNAGHRHPSLISMSTPAGRWSRRWSESTVFGVGW